MAIFTLLRHGGSLLCVRDALLHCRHRSSGECILTLSQLRAAVVTFVISFLFRLCSHVSRLTFMKEGLLLFLDKKVGKL